MSGLASRKTRGGLGRRSKRGEDDKQLGGGKQSSSNPASAQSHVPTRSPVEDKSQEPEEQTGQQQLEIPLDEGQQEQENQHHHQQQHTLLVDHVGRVSYVVAVRKDHPTNFYVKDLELSMDLMAMDNALPGMAVHIPTSVDGTLETSKLSCLLL